MALTAGEPPSADSLARALGANAEDRAAGLAARRRATFRPCAGCAEPEWCTGFRPLVGGPAESPDCVWREHLSRGLKEWWLESPAEAFRVVRFASERTPRSTRDTPENGTGHAAFQFDEPLEPSVRTLLDDVRIGPGGHAYVERYAERVLEIGRLDPATNAPTFLQLATLACRYADQSDRRGLARSFARLARIGLEPLARQG
jgi:hypothetical protein